MDKLTVADIRECVRQLRSMEVKPTNGMYWFPASEEVQTFCFIARTFPSWLAYV